MFNYEMISYNLESRLTVKRVSGSNDDFCGHPSFFDIEPNLAVVTKGKLKIEGTDGRIEVCEVGSYSPQDFCCDVVLTAIDDMEYICLHSVCGYVVYQPKITTLMSGQTYNKSSEEGEFLIVCLGSLDGINSLQVVPNDKISITALEDTTIVVTFGSEKINDIQI